MAQVSLCVSDYRAIFGSLNWRHDINDTTSVWHILISTKNGSYGFLGLGCHTVFLFTIIFISTNFGRII